MKCPIGYTFDLPISLHLLRCWCNTCTNQSPNDMIHFISSRDRIGSSILTSLALHRCVGPSAPSLAQASPSHVVPFFEASDLPFTLATGPSSQVMSWSSPPWSHDLMSHLMCNEHLHQHMCVSFATSPSHLYHHGICCLHTCTYGLITCVSHITTISPPKVVTQLSKPNKDLLIFPFLVIDDNSTKIWKLSSF
jgi:hypothetical protein